MVSAMGTQAVDRDALHRRRQSAKEYRTLQVTGLNTTEIMSRTGISYERLQAAIKGYIRNKPAYDSYILFPADDFDGLEHFARKYDKEKAAHAAQYQHRKLASQRKDADLLNGWGKMPLLYSSEEELFGCFEDTLPVESSADRLEPPALEQNSPISQGSSSQGPRVRSKVIMGLRLPEKRSLANQKGVTESVIAIAFQGYCLWPNETKTFADLTPEEIRHYAHCYLNRRSLN